MQYDFLPRLLGCFVCESGACELRLRAGRQAFVLARGKYLPVVIKGAPYICSAREICDIVAKACGNSVYAYSDAISRGYISCAGGVRIGLCGECVREGGKVVTVKNFSSLCVRFAREVKGCGEKVYSLALSSRVKNLMIISPPAAGKTTLLRDLVRLTSLRTKKNVLVIDEREEIFSFGFDLGETVDVLSLSDKRFGFYTAVQTLAPELVAADELVDKSDADGALFALRSGVKVFCTVHGENFADAAQKNYLSELLKEIDFFVTLKKSAGGGFELAEAGTYGELIKKAKSEA